MRPHATDDRGDRAHDRVAGPTRRARVPDGGIIRPAEASLLALSRRAGNRAVASLIGADGPRPAVAVQRLVGGPIVVQRQGLLRVGSRGRAVSALQEALNGGGEQLTVDGIFGKATRAAVVRHQASAGLNPDGLVGPQTRASLGLGGGGGGGGAGHQVELGHTIAEAVGHQVQGGPGAGGGGRAIGGSVAVPSMPSYRAGGAVDTESGAVSGGVSGPIGGVGASYDPGTGTVSAGGTSVGGATAGGSYNTETGEVSGGVTSASGNTYEGAWNPETHTASGGYASASGSTTAGGYADVDSGTGTGYVNTPYGSGTLTVGEGEVTATVDVPGIGSVDVDVERPDWL